MRTYLTFGQRREEPRIALVIRFCPFSVGVEEGLKLEAAFHVN